MPGSIFGDYGNRGLRRGPVETVAEAGLDLVFGQMMPQKNEAVRERQLAGKRKIGGVAEIRIAILGPYPPIVGDGIFDAAARSPTGARVGEGRIGSRNAGEEACPIDKFGVEVSEGDAAGAVDQNAVEGDSNAAAHRPLDI